jgi:polysaccharide deacetylase family protein (PEP-CTERM system associated)
MSGAPLVKYVFIQNDPFYLPKVLDKYLREFADSTAGINIQSVAQGKRSVLQTAMDLYRLYGFRYFQWKLRRYLWAKIMGRLVNDALGSTRRCWSVKAVARKYGVPVTQAVDVNSQEFLKHLRDLKVQFIVSISGTQLYRQALREQTPRGIVNCHGALLPKYRGLMPSFWTLCNGETEGGVTVHFVDAKLDNGPILVQKRYRIHAHDTLEDIMARSTIRCRRGRTAAASAPPAGGSSERLSAVESMVSSAAIPNALSFDIEDWFHMVEIDAVSDPRNWPSLESIVERYTRWIVQTVTEADVKATFFVLGWVAERYPQLVRMMAEHGHEVGTHSYWHRKVYELTPREFAEDLRRSIDVIESAGGRKVLGFRAPSFSITPGAEWAFDVMHEAGLVYDASLFPAARGHGGYPCPVQPHTFRGAPSGRPMPELPMSVMRLGPMRVPFSGGGYLRLLPGWVIRRGFEQLHARRIGAVVYLHPRDFAPDCPRVPMPLTRRFKCYVGLRSTADKLKMLLRTYRFEPCAAVLGLTGREDE